MKLRKIIISFYILLGLVSVAHAEEVSIFEAGIKIELGMPKSKILEYLKKDFNLVRLPQDKEDMVYVQAKDTNQNVLVLRFEDNRLSLASHFWKMHDEHSSAYSLGSSLIALITKIIGDKSEVVSISTTSSTGRGSEYNQYANETLKINFPQCTIYMDTSCGPGGNHVNIREMIHK